MSLFLCKWFSQNRILEEKKYSSTRKLSIPNPPISSTNINHEISNMQIYMNKSNSFSKHNQKNTGSGNYAIYSDTKSTKAQFALYIIMIPRLKYIHEYDPRQLHYTYHGCTHHQLYKKQMCTILLKLYYQIFKNVVYDQDIMVTHLMENKIQFKYNTE